MRTSTSESVSRLYTALCCSFPFPLSLGTDLLNTISLEHSCQGCPLALEGWCLVHEVQVLAFEEEAVSLKEEEGTGLEELEPENLVAFFDFLFFLLQKVWGAESPLPPVECRFKNLFLTSWKEEASLAKYC
jgi:hypothetical protein